MFVEHEKRVATEPSREPQPLADWQKLLLKAAELIETGGHCKGQLQIGNSFCMYGAIKFAAMRSVSLTPTVSCWEAIERVNAVVGGLMACWNNEPQRTPEEVVAKLRAVALGG